MQFAGAALELEEPIEEILSIADIFLMPSGSETFGLAALEAMACGVPVVASDIGGIPELVLHEETGFLCPLGDIEAYTERVGTLLENEELRLQLARASRTRAVDVFEVSIIVPLYESYYDRVLEGATANVV